MQDNNDITFDCKTTPASMGIIVKKSQNAQTAKISEIYAANDRDRKDCCDGASRRN